MVLNIVKLIKSNKKSIIVWILLINKIILTQCQNKFKTHLLTQCQNKKIF